MVRNVSSIRQRFSSLGLSSRSSRKICSAMLMRSKYQKSSDSSDSENVSGTFKSDRFSSSVSNSLLTLGSSASLSECRVKAAQSMNTLAGTCGNFDAAMKKNLADAGVPESVEFEFDYDLNSGKTALTGISDESFADGVKSALDKTLKKVSLDVVAKGSNILNGKMTAAYYPAVAEALEKSFGQDIADLSTDSKGNIIGMNRKLRAAVNYELLDSGFDARSRYGFPAKELASVVKSIVSDKSASGGVSHMSFSGGSLKTSDGDISVSKNCRQLSLKKTNVILRAAAAGDPSSMELWAGNGDLFR
ncbi:MAG: hypothetical protein NC395_02800 [Prevotella sp.]|nr:hypothetical protein [Prevotella sp.]